MRCVASNYFAAAATIAADAAAATVAYVNIRNIPEAIKDTFSLKNIYTIQNFMQTTNITVVIMSSVLHTFMISLKAGTQTQFSVTVLAVIACLSAFLLFIFVGVGAAHLALAVRTQFLFSRRDLHEMSLPLTLSILTTLSCHSHPTNSQTPNQKIHSPYCSKA